MEHLYFCLWLYLHIVIYTLYYTHEYCVVQTSTFNPGAYRLWTYITIYIYIYVYILYIHVQISLLNTEISSLCWWIPDFFCWSPKSRHHGGRMERARHTLISWNLPWWLCARPGIDDSVMYVISRIYVSFYIQYCIWCYLCVVQWCWFWLTMYMFIHGWYAQLWICWFAWLL